MEATQAAKAKGCKGWTERLFAKHLSYARHFLCRSCAQIARQQMQRATSLRTFFHTNHLPTESLVSADTLAKVEGKEVCLITGAWAMLLDKLSCAGYGTSSCAV